MENIKSFGHNYCEMALWRGWIFKIFQWFKIRLVDGLKYYTRELAQRIGCAAVKYNEEQVALKLQDSVDGWHIKKYLIQSAPNLKFPGQLIKYPKF